MALTRKSKRDFLRELFYKLRFHNHRICIGCGTRISRRSVVRLDWGGDIRIGRNCEILEYAMILSYGGVIEIGDECSVNPFCVIYGHGGLKIGNGVRIAAHTVIIPSNHTFGDVDVPIMRQPLESRGIIIEDNVWIGAGCRILDGVRIGRGSVIGAGAVVTSNIPEFSVALGVPARPVRNRKDEPRGERQLTQ